MAAGSSSISRGLLDTSVFVATEAGRALGNLPKAAAVSVITLAELRLGVLLARDSATRARRRHTLETFEKAFDPIPIDSEVAKTFAELVAEARRQGRKPKIMDRWIAATAVIHDLIVYTQDSDFSPIPSVRVAQV